MSYTWRIKLMSVILFIVLLNFGETSVCAQEDFVIENVYEAALDLPRILFLLKREPSGPPLMTKGHFELNYAFLDTGASGIVLSRETAGLMGLAIDPKARFADIGVGGVEFFNVSESLYIGLSGYNAQDPGDPGSYRVIGPGRFQIKQNMAGLLGEPLDIIGMPAMIGRVVVLDSGATNSLGYFSANIKNPGDSAIPRVDLEVVLRFRKFQNPNNPNNIPPLPVMARNPVIDNIVVHHKSMGSRGSWLLDTGATISLISVKQAMRLGLTDRNGVPLVTPDFSLPLGGIGEMIQVPGFEIDKLTVPTRSGRNLVFKNARLGVHNIRFFDEEKKAFTTLDGVFASNFLCASAKMQSFLPTDVSQTIFDKVVIDMQRGALGFRFGRKLKR
jgi:hypothetical protein